MPALDRKTIATELRNALAKLVDLAEAAALADDDAEAEEIAGKAADLGGALARALAPQRDHDLDHPGARGGRVSHYGTGVAKGAVSWPSDLSAEVTRKRAEGRMPLKPTLDHSEALAEKKRRARGGR